MPRAEVSLTHVRTGLNHHIRIDEDMTIHQLKCLLIVQMKRQFGASSVRERPEDIIILQANGNEIWQFQGQQKVSRVKVARTMDDGENFYIMEFVLAKDFEAEKEDIPDGPSSSTLAESPEVAQSSNEEASNDDASSQATGVDEATSGYAVENASTAVPANAEPDVEPDGEPSVAVRPAPDGTFRIIIRDVRKTPTVETTMHFDPDQTLAKFRDISIKQVLHTTLANAKSLTFSRVRGGNSEPIANFRLKIKTFLMDGEIVAIGNRGQGGVRTLPKQTKKDMATKVADYKKAMTDASSLINRESISQVSAVQNAERVLQTFASNVEANVENALMSVFGNLSIQKIDGIYAELSKKGGNMETKLATVSVGVFALEDVVVASDSISNVLQSASSMLMYGVAKLNAENNVKDMSAVKTILDRVKFMKMGQQSMASAPTGTDVPM